MSMYSLQDFEDQINIIASNHQLVEQAFREMNPVHKKYFLDVGYKMITNDPEPSSLLAAFTMWHMGVLRDSMNMDIGGWNGNDIQNIFELMVTIMYFRLKRPDDVTIDSLQLDNQKENVKDFIKKFFTKISEADDQYNKQTEQQKEARKKHKENEKRKRETEKVRHKAIFKEQEEKKKNRKRNKFCKNDTEFFTTEDIEDIPTEELTFIKYNESIFCLDSMSYVNMLKHSNSQKVRGDCKPPIPNKPLECKNFYPINIGFNFFINEKSYKKRIKAVNKKIQKRKFILKNKKRINFDTGLHIIGIKQGWDDVYDLEPANYAIPQSTQEISKKISKKKIEKLKNYTVKQLKAECKRKGIKGYSKLKKSELILHCSVSDARKKKITVKELRQQCKKLKIKGYSKWKKAELMKNCNK